MLYAIGDIHGQITMLLSLLDGLPLEPDDTLVFLGDYVDRGEDSRAVVETLLGMREQFRNTIFLRGNHEQLMLDACNGSSPEQSPASGMFLHSSLTLNWLQNGGTDTLISYGVDDFTRWWEPIPAAHWEFIRATQMEHITERYHFVHAGLLPPSATWEGAHWEMTADPRLWIREPFLSSNADFDGRIVVFGHTPQMSGSPLVQRNKIGLDTGAVYGGPLTAVALDLDMPPTGTYRFYQIASS